MKNYKRRLIISAIFTALFLSGAGLVVKLYLSGQSKADQIVQDSSDLSELFKNSSEIQRLWWEGEESKEWSEVKSSCLKKWKIVDEFDETLLRCNPKLIECVSEFSKNKSLKIESELNLVGKSNSEIFNLKEGGYLVTIKHSKTNRSLSFILKNFCHEKFLDQRIYAYGERPKKGEGEDYLFDNLNQNIYFDTHLALNYEVNDFLKAVHEPQKETTSTNWFLPSVDLNLETMEKFCNFHGKELMSAEIYDAATFLPNSLDEKNPKEISRGPYFWTKKTKLSHEELNNCEQIFSKECLVKQKYRTNIVGPSWAGLKDSMGTVMEVVRNPVEPEKNLKASSFYLPFNSKWHRLGMRSHWTGEGHDLRHFFVHDLELDSSIDFVQVGFRCQRRVN